MWPVLAWRVAVSCARATNILCVLLPIYFILVFHFNPLVQTVNAYYKQF